MFMTLQDCCISTGCPRYTECGRAFRSGSAQNYYTMGSHEEWCDTEGNHGSKDWWYCGENGGWRMFLKKESKIHE